MREHTEDFLGRFDSVRELSQSSWQARCPCRNDDSNPSVTITEKDDGAILVYCHRGTGCGAREICETVGLSLLDLLPPERRTGNFSAEAKREPEKKTPKKKPVIEKAPKEDLRLVQTYSYIDEDGTLLFQKLRFVDSSGNKTFRQRRPNSSGGWDYRVPDDVPKILYNLPAVLKAKSEGRSIWLVEGEKDADALTALGEVATTMPNGAGSWKQLHTDALAGATVDIVADNDEPGRRHALHVKSELNNAGSDAQAWICPRGKDIFDFLEMGGTFDELLVLRDDQDSPNDGSEESIHDNDNSGSKNEEIGTVPARADEPQHPASRQETVIAEIRELLKRDISPATMLNRASLLIASAATSGPINPGKLVEWSSFVAESDDDNYDWLIPGLLERRERVIVVAAEGVGKTMLARQVAILPANGIEPFTFKRMKQIRTLTVDLENPERIIRRTSRSIFGACRHYRFTDTSDAHLVIKNDGLNLLNMEDRLLLETYMDAIKPDLLVMGPLYKSFIDPGNRTSEAVVIEVVKYLDQLRVAYNCALWLEHHAPLGESMTSRNLRPFGSAVWSRWPEFGLSLQPDPTAVGEYIYDVKHFRGERDERHWPVKMKRGKIFPFEALQFRERHH